MLRLPPFRYRTPATLGEAAVILADEGPSARVVAGGTDLWPNMKRRHQKAQTVVSLMGIPGLSGLEANGQGLTIGATTLLEDVAHHPLVRPGYPALARAVLSISSPALRNLGTLGGNVCVDTRCTYYNQTEEWRRSIDYCMKEEGTICWVAPGSSRCWAHSASDAAPVLCALGARARLASSAGDREVPLPALYRDDGIDYLAKRPDEILTHVILPGAAASPRCRTSFWKLRRRGSIDFAVLSVAAAVWAEADGTVADAALWLGAVGSWPLRVDDARQALVGHPLSEETIAAAAGAARRAATPMDNTDFQAQWRGVMVARYTEAALGEVAGLETTGLPPAHLL